GELKIFLFQIGNDLAIVVAHDDAHEDQVNAHLKRRRRIVGNDFVVGCLRIRLGSVLGCVSRWGLSSLRSCGRSLSAGNGQASAQKNATEKSEPESSWEIARRPAEWTRRHQSSTCVKLE